MPFLSNCDVKLHYEVYGTGQPLILSHGFSSTLEMWRGQIDAFSKDFKLIIWSMRGHGQTDYPEEPSAYSEANTVSDIAALLDHIVPDKAQKVIVGGLSLGGYMSLAFYRAYPERVSKLLIIDTGPGFKKDSARGAWNQTAYNTARSFEQKGLGVLQQASPERSMVTHRNAAGLAHAARGMLTQRDDTIIMSLPQIRVPSLIVVGSEDKPFLAASDYMTAKIPGAKKAVIGGAGHASNIDQPEDFNRVILSFLESKADPSPQAKL